MREIVPSDKLVKKSVIKIKVNHSEVSRWVGSFHPSKVELSRFENNGLRTLWLSMKCNSGSLNATMAKSNCRNRGLIADRRDGHYHRQ